YFCVMELADGVELYRLLVQSVQDYAIYALDPRGRIVSWNEGAQRLKGYTGAEVIGQHLSLFYPPTDKDLCDRALSIAFAEGRFEGEGWRVRKDGSRFWANAIITSLHGPSGEHLGFVKVTRDLTERRAAEERRIADAARVASEETARRDAEANAHELQLLVDKLEDQMLELEQQREELQTLTEELTQTNDELQDAMKAADVARADADSANQAKSLFLAVTSHELRTPINAIIGYTDLMSDEIVGTLNEVQRRHLGRVRMSAQHLLALIENVLTLSRIEARREVVQVTNTDVCAITRESAELLTPAAAAKGLWLRLEMPEEPCWLRTDATKVKQVLINLISNAVKFTDEGGVALKLVPANGTVRIDVRDTGIGIPRSSFDQVFEAYWRATQERGNPRMGTGLGLSVAKRLAEMLGGSIEVASAVGIGSTFTLLLPASER
ncbi:MAG TPA: ATP-binding protein, partial [Gemmatimonadaceae bacterium]|nr:ATP-binding protein [Gemmatimonadaceae bacterium]